MRLRIKLSGKLNCFDSCDPGSDAVHFYHDHGHVYDRPKQCFVFKLVPDVKPSAPLDIMFLQDITGSQQPYIDSARSQISQICNTLISGGKFALQDLRFGLIAFRGHPPQDQSFGTQEFPFLRFRSRCVESSWLDSDWRRHFLTDEQSSSKFFIDLPKAQRNLAFASLQVMKDGLCFNICELKSSHLPNSEDPGLQERVQKHILPHLSYSSRFWTLHVRTTAFDKELVKEVKLLLFDHERLFSWLELLALINALGGAVPALSLISQWLKGHSEFKDVSSTAMDVQWFIQVSSVCISTPILACQLSAIENVFVQFLNTLRVASGRNMNWPVVQTVLRGHTESVTSVSFSPDSTRIITGLDDKTVQLWNAGMGEPVGEPLRGRTDSVVSVSFSLDDTRIVAGSEGKTVRLWDAVMRQQLQQCAVPDPLAFSDENCTIEATTTMTLNTSNNHFTSFSPNSIRALCNTSDLMELASHDDRSLAPLAKVERPLKPANKDVFKKPRFGNTAFTIAHYAHDVTYEVEGFLEKNRDTVPDEHMLLLASTKNPFLKEVLDAALGSVKVADPPHPGSPFLSDSGSGGSRRSSITPDPGRSSLVAANASPKRPGAAIRKPTQGSIFKASLITQMDTLSITNVHYIRCTKPNEAKRPWEFTPSQVLGQLRACGVLEPIHISCAGYPSRWTYEEFAEWYDVLVPSADWQPMIQHMELKPLCSLILERTINDPDKYQSGLTKIFFRAGMLTALESLRSEKLNALVTIVQKNMRRRMAVKKYQELRRATIKVQTWWRGILACRLVENIHRDFAAKCLQTGIRRFIQRYNFLKTRRSIVLFQSPRRLHREKKTSHAAILLQSLFRGMLYRCRHKTGIKCVISLWEQLNRANAYNALTRNARVETPASPTFALALRTPDSGGLSNGAALVPPSSNQKSTLNYRAVSVAYNGENNVLRMRNGLADVRSYDDLAEEKIKLMQDTKRLDEDVLVGLIRGLKIPAPSLTNPSAVKEILFPANLISLVTNEMWKYGLIPESEWFLANIMESIQHAMSFSGEDSIIPGIYWLSNVHEMPSFIYVAESDMLQGIGPGEENAV
ncbi:hypothetical protein F4604DRAFT_1933355 [Suillus subluteus]|nr:hypothetical protein F4604DRAFT_1933355 [Suillus subluteus]